MKNVLIIPPFNPYPLVSGGHQGIFNGIAILKDIANVYVYIETTESKHNRGEDTAIEKVLPFVHVLYNIDSASRHTVKWYLNVLWNKINSYLPHRNETKIANVSKTPQSILQSIDDIPEHRRQFLLDAIQRYQIDIVQVDMMTNIKLVNYLPKDVRKIFIQHEIKFVRDELFLQTIDNITLELQEQYIQGKQEEIELHNKYDYVVTVSPIDAEKLKDAGVTTTIIPSLSVVNHVDNVEGKKPISKILSYVGPEMHYPNYDGVMWFLDNCWSKLMELDDEYTFQIIGLWSEDTANELLVKYNGKVRCVGFVENLAEALDGTTMIVPLNIGSGIRMKILEAAQLNVPVVTTPVGGEGLPLIDGENCFVTNNPSQFVDDILKLQDKSLREKFITNLRRVIASKYSIQALKESRENLYK